MQKLKLNLEVMTAAAFPVSLSLRVFDHKSLYLADRMIRSGGFGQYSKAKFYLTGLVHWGNGEWEQVTEPFYIRRSSPLVKTKWQINPKWFALISMSVPVASSMIK